MMITPKWDRLRADCANKRSRLSTYWRHSEIREAVNEGAGAWKTQIEVMIRELDEARADDRLRPALAMLWEAADAVWLAYNSPDTDIARAMHALGEALSHFYDDGTPRTKEAPENA